MPSVNDYTHVEILTNDPETSARFHEKAYGWNVQRFGPEFGGYIMYTTPAGVTGGFRKPEAGESVGVLPYVQTDDLDKKARALVSAGAQEIAPRQEIPGFGTMALFAVPGGTVEALWQPAPAA